MTRSSEDTEHRIYHMNAVTPTLRSCSPPGPIRNVTLNRVVVRSNVFVVSLNEEVLLPHIPPHKFVCVCGAMITFPPIVELLSPTQSFVLGVCKCIQCRRYLHEPRMSVPDGRRQQQPHWRERP